MASISAYEVDATVRKVKGTGMVNRILQLICTGEGLTKYGVKAELQQKIIDSESVPSRYHAASPSPVVCTID
jgi:E3 SUMO-protein ligase PIAS1